MKKLFITCAFAAAAASALMLIGVHSAETPNLGEMDEDGAKVCVLANDCNWGDQIPDEFAETIEVEPGVTFKQIQKDIQDAIDVLFRVVGMPLSTERNGVVIINDDPGGNPRAFWSVFQFYARKNSKVEVRGDCISACTLIVGAIDKSKLCF